MSSKWSLERTRGKLEESRESIENRIKSPSEASTSKSNTLVIYTFNSGNTRESCLPKKNHIQFTSPTQVYMTVRLRKQSEYGTDSMRRQEKNWESQKQQERSWKSRCTSIWQENDEERGDLWGERIPPWK